MAAIKNQIFQYNGSPISFQKGDSVMVNATEMAKSFGKSPKDFLKTEQTKRFIAALSEVKKILSSDLVRVIYGDNGGTWMHEDVAIEFARWLNPAFAIWCNDRIKELLTVGMTATQPTLEQMIDNPDLVIKLATELKQKREEVSRLQMYSEQQQATIELQEEQLKELKNSWPGATLSPETQQQTQTLLSLLQETNSEIPILSVCLSGTDLQRQVWKALLQVHKGETSSYTQIAQTVGRPKAVRAVASAIGKNPVSWIIPCHRILHKDGSLSGYRWNAKRKQQLLDWERTK